MHAEVDSLDAKGDDGQLQLFKWSEVELKLYSRKKRTP